MITRPMTKLLGSMTEAPVPLSLSTSPASPASPDPTLGATVSPLQLRFLRRRFLKSLATCGTLMGKFSAFKAQKLATDPKSLTYARDLDRLYRQVTAYVSNRGVLESVSRMLTRYYRWISRDDPSYHTRIAPKLDARKFLSSFVISLFPEFTLEADHNTLVTTKQGLNYDVYILANEVTTLMGAVVAGPDPDPGKLGTLSKMINSYSNAFSLFLSQDRIKKVDELVARYRDLEGTIAEVSRSNRYATDQKETIIKNLREEQTMTIACVKRTDPDFDLKILDQYTRVADQFERTMKQCYWDVLEADIVKGDYTFLVQVLGEIKSDIIQLHKSSAKELDEYIDTDFIRQKLDHNVMQFADFVALADYLVAKILALQAPVRNPETRDTWSAIKTHAQSAILSANDPVQYSRHYATAVRESVKFILENIQTIREDIATVVSSMTR